MSRERVAGQQPCPRRQVGAPHHPRNSQRRHWALKKKKIIDPSVDEWIDKIWYIYTTEYYLAIKRDEVLRKATRMNLERNMMLSEAGAGGGPTLSDSTCVEDQKRQIQRHRR